MENKKLEEAAEAFVNTIGGNNQNGRNQRFAARIAFRAGSRWQQEQNEELLHQRDELAKALKDMLSRFEHCEEGMIKADHVKEQARIALSKTNP